MLINLFDSEITPPPPIKKNPKKKILKVLHQKPFSMSSASCDSFKELKQMSCKQSKHERHFVL